MAVLELEKIEQIDNCDRLGLPGIINIENPNDDSGSLQCRDFYSNDGSGVDELISAGQGKLVCKNSGCVFYAYGECATAGEESSLGPSFWE